MQKIICMLILLLGFSVFGQWTGEARAGVTIKVRALNPLETEEEAIIKYPLPQEVTRRDILGQKVTYSMELEDEEEPRKTRLNISVDGETQRHYIDDKVLLLPKEVVTIEVRVRDVWKIDEAQIQALRQEVTSLLTELEGQTTESPETELIQESEEEQAEDPQLDLSEEEETKEIALMLKEEILSELDQIIKRQNAHVIVRVGVQRHIEAYQDNIGALRQVQQDIMMLANLIRIDEEEQEQDSESQELEEDGASQETD